MGTPKEWRELMPTKTDAQHTAVFLTPALCNKLYSTGLKYEPYGDDHWAGGSAKDIADVLTKGNIGALSKAKAMQAHVTRSSKDVARQIAPSPSVCGGAVNVPAYLAGAPLAFSRLLPNEQPRGIRIFAEIGASSGFTSEQLLNRGLAVLGLAYALQRLRPVELYAINLSSEEHQNSSARTYCKVVALGVNPIDWTAASAIIGHPGTFRRFGIGVGGLLWKGDPQTGGNLYTLNDPDPKLRALLGIRPDDLVLSGGLWGTDKGRLALTHPEKWVTGAIAMFNKGGKL